MEDDRKSMMNNQEEGNNHNTEILSERQDINVTNRQIRKYKQYINVDGIVDQKRFGQIGTK